MSPSRALYDAQGRQVRLGNELGTGGEGTVYALASDDQTVAKIYHERPTTERAAKIVTMVLAAHPELLSISAWPNGTLHAAPGGPLVGLLMPRVSGYRPIHELYSPAQRKLDFPKADWSFLVQTARNVTSAFASIHRHGHVIGDVNQGNVVVSVTATARLIDCDSFQITSNGKRYLCEVGVAHFTPPELQGGSFGGIVRNENHDRFGLAVLIFHLLFMGRHPFAGIFKGRGDMPLERAIAEARFAFGRDAAAKQMECPPHVLTFRSVTPTVANLFERAFASPTAGQRPSAPEWIAALEDMQRSLRTCSDHPGHKFAPVAGACPWCAIERGGGPDFFISIAVVAAAGATFDLDAFCRALFAIPQPKPDLPIVPSTAVLEPNPLPPRLIRWRRAVRVTGALSGVSLLLAFGLGIWGTVPFGIFLVLAVAFNKLSGLGEERSRRKSALELAKHDHGLVSLRWAEDVQKPAEAMARARQEVEKLRDRYRQLPQEYQRDKSQLESGARERQLKHFLERHMIRSASIKGIGSGLAGTLAAYGIETAADVSYHRVQRVPGIGPARASALVSWRSSVEHRFQFNPKLGIDPADLSALDREYARKRKDLEQALQQHGAEIRRLSNHAKQGRAALTEEYVRTAQAKAQAEVDLAA